MGTGEPGGPAETLHSPDSRQRGPSPPHQLRSERQESAPLARDTEKGSGALGALGRSGAWQAPACGLGMRAEEGAPVPGALAPASRLQSSVPSLGSGGLRTDADSWKVVRSVQNKQGKMAAA